MKVNGYCLQRNSTASNKIFGSYVSGQKDVWFEKIAPSVACTVTLNNNGVETTLTEETAGAGVTLPTLTDACTD